MGLSRYARGRTAAKISFSGPGRATDIREVAEVAAPRLAGSLIFNVSNIVPCVFLVILGGSRS